MLDVNEMNTLADNVNALFPERIYGALIRADANGELSELLRLLNMSELDQSDYFYSYKEGKIVVIGDSSVKKEHLIAIIKKVELDPDRFEFNLEYDAGKTYNYNKLKYNSNYRLVIFGAMPHKTKGTGKCSSVIENIRESDGYPRVEKLWSNNELKLTKSNFKEKLIELIDEGFI